MCVALGTKPVTKVPILVWQAAESQVENHRPDSNIGDQWLGVLVQFLSMADPTLSMTARKKPLAGAPRPVADKPHRPNTMPFSGCDKSLRSRMLYMATAAGCLQV